jgi:hypothetical protein
MHQSQDFPLDLGSFSERDPRSPRFSQRLAEAQANPNAAIDPRLFPISQCIFSVILTSDPPPLSIASAIAFSGTSSRLSPISFVELHGEPKARSIYNAPLTCYPHATSEDEGDPSLLKSVVSEFTPPKDGSIAGWGSVDSKEHMIDEQIRSDLPAQDKKTDLADDRHKLSGSSCCITCCCRADMIQ